MYPEFIRGTTTRFISVPSSAHRFSDHRSSFGRKRAVIDDGAYTRVLPNRRALLSVCLHDLYRTQYHVNRHGKRHARVIQILCSSPSPCPFTWVSVGVWREHHAQTGLVVDRVARVVAVARLQAVSQHQRAGYAVEQVVGSREHVPGNQFEPRHVGVAVLQGRGRRRCDGQQRQQQYGGGGGDHGAPRVRWWRRLIREGLLA